MTIQKTTPQLISEITFFNLPEKLKAIFNRLPIFTKATNIAAIGTTTAITAVPGAFADATAARTYLATAIPIIEGRLDVIETKIDAITSALKTAGLMQTA